MQAETNSIKGDASITITTRDFEVEGTITLQDGILTWGDIEENVPGIKIINVPNFVAKDAYSTLDVKRKGVSNDAEIRWTSGDTSIATIEENTGKVKGISEGTATITASVTGTDYTAQCTIRVREIVMPQVGDFVTYDAGSWTTDANNNILIHYTDGTTEAVADSATKPSSDHKFGGFTTTSGKNGNATPYNDSYNYVKEGTNAVTGWRIFDIADNGTITLISAGCPEDYYHAYSTNNGYKSEYILSGNHPANIEVTGLKVRDWTADYVSAANQTKGITASVLTKTKLDAWYTKYTNTASANTYTQATFRKVYKNDANEVNGGKYESLIDNYSYYWLASAHSGYPSYLYYVNPNGRYVRSNYGDAYGVRVLVSLPSSISLTETPSGTKTITSRGNDYTYNVWGIN